MEIPQHLLHETISPETRRCSLIGSTDNPVVATGLHAEEPR
jgi:hypothetical protein